MIRKYQPEDFIYLTNWISDPKILFVFAGPSWNFPITIDQINDHQNKFPHKQLYIGLDDDGIPFAIGEIIGHEPNAPRIGRLLIGDPAKRGFGLGKKFITALINQCLEVFPTHEICLFVLEENSIAIRAYKNLGFLFTTDEIPDMLYDNQFYPVKKMVLRIT